MRFNLFNQKQIEMTQYLLTPDRSVNNKKTHDLFRSLSSFHCSPLDVIRGKTNGALWWDVMIRYDEIRFYCTMPTEWKREIRLQLESVWPLCSIEEVENKTVIPSSSVVCEMKLRRNNIFALQIDRRVELEPLNSILSITGEMYAGDIGRLSICAQPLSRLDWQDTAERLHKEFRQGKTPRRTRLTKKDLLVSLGESIANVLQSLFDTLNVAMGGDEQKKKSDDYEKREIMIDGSLTRGTVNKLKTPTFNTFIRLASHSPDPSRQQIILRTLSNSFNDLTADNELERNDIHPKLQPRIVNELNTFKLSYLTRLDWDKNVMSNEEISRLVELPTAALQDVHRDKLETLDMRQLEVPAQLTKGGLLLGEVSFKKQSVPVYMPTKDHDQLCLPSVVIGGMGSGKTKGFACHRGVGFVEAGYSAILFDPKKSEVWEKIEKSLPKEKRQRILLGETPISLDFREALRTPSGKARLSQIMLTFFNDNTDTAGPQTQRFLRAAVMGMRTGKFSEIVKIFRDKSYLQETINSLPKDSTHRQTLQEYHDYKTDRQAQILAPVLNRMDMILGDPYLEACMNCDKGLDMTEILSKKEVCTVIDIPDRLNSRLAKDVLVNIISFKIDTAMGLRKEDFPFAIIYDEPHQYLRSVDLWKNVAVEARAYRLSYTWMFHSWEQIPNDLAQIIKDAGPHYYIYQSSKKTYTGLKEELAPFSLEDGLNTKRWHAICALKVGDNRLTPFMCHMTQPV